MFVILKLETSLFLSSYHPSIFCLNLHSSGYESSKALHICKEESGYVMVVGPEHMEN